MNRWLGSTTCPICGWPSLEEPPFDEDNEGSDEICPSCGAHFGFDDEGLWGAPLEARFVELRQSWVRAGCPWWSKRLPPPSGWDPWEQLYNAGLVPPQS
jgi:hypothetical protein